MNSAYLSPLDEVVIGKAKQQEALSSSEIEIGLNYPQNVVTYGSSTFSIVGYSMEQSSSTFSLTDSRDTVSKSVSENRKKVREFYSFVK